MTNQSDAANHDSAIINIRKLAALDMVFHRPKLILAEFAFGVLGPAALGMFVASPGFFAGHRNPLQVLVSSYLLCIALNYVPLLLYAISIARGKKWRLNWPIKSATRASIACSHFCWCCRW